MVDRSFTDAELDAAIRALSQPGRLREAQELVLRTTPALERVLRAALEDGGWWGPAHQQAVDDATLPDDRDERTRAVRTLLAEETRLGMLVGVAVGFELARQLSTAQARQEE